jgi:ABC-type multidrug transport system ATPase subunit
MSEAAIHTEGLTKRYKAREAVSSLNLTVERGALCGVLGPNGSGKTTTIRMLLGLVRPSAGHARVLGHALDDRRAICAQVGAIIESPAFYPYLSARKNLEVLADLAPTSAARGRVTAVLERVGLSSRANDKVSTYSLGMKQRLGVGATLLTDPQLLFLDEPTNGLDPAGIIEMRELLLSLKHEGKTVLISSHQLGEIERVCTDVVVLHEGRTKLAGPMRALLNPTRRVAIRARPVATVLEVLGRLSLTEAPTVEGDEVIAALEEPQVPGLVRALAAAEVEVFALAPRVASLEEKFLELTRGSP